MFSPTRARTRRATWLTAAGGLAIAATLVVIDLLQGWRWFHVVLAVSSLLGAIRFVRGAVDWYEPRRVMDETPDHDRPTGPS